MADGCCHLTHNLHAVDSEVLALDVELIGLDVGNHLRCKFQVEYSLAGREVCAIENVVPVGAVGAELYLCVALSGVIDAHKVTFPMSSHEASDTQSVAAANMAAIALM